MTGRGLPVITDRPDTGCRCTFVQAVDCESQAPQNPRGWRASHRNAPSNSKTPVRIRRRLV